MKDINDILIKTGDIILVCNLEEGCLDYGRVLDTREDKVLMDLGLSEMYWTNCVDNLCVVRPSTYDLIIERVTRREESEANAELLGE